LLGAADAAEKAGKAIVSALTQSFTDTAKDAMDLALMSEKLGTNIEWLSKWTAAASTVNVSAEQLAMGLKLFQRNAAEAVDGSKPAREAFAKLGISTRYLKDHLGDVAGLFTTVKERLDNLPDSAHNIEDAWKVMGRGSNELAPLLKLTGDELKHLFDIQKQLGDVTTEQEGKAGLAWKRLTTEFDEMMAGIEKAASKPVLEFLASHIDEIEKDMVKVSQTVQSVVNEIWTKLEGPEGKAFFGETKEFTAKMIAELPVLGAEASKLISQMVADLPAAAADLKSMWDNAKGFVDEITKLMGLLPQLQKHPSQEFHGSQTPWLDSALAQRMEENDASKPPPPPKRRPTPGPDGVDWNADFDTRQKEIDAQWRNQGTVNNTIVIHLPPNASPDDVGRAARREVEKAQANANAAASMGGH